MTAMSSTMPYNHSGNDEVLTIEAHVILGELSKKCKGMGVCSITLEPPLKNTTGQPPIQIRIQSTHNKQLKFIFQKKMMSQWSISNFFGSDYFKVGETFKVPENVLAQLGLPAFSIMEGQYPIEEEAELFIIEF
jgi:hypothetical protein